MEYRAKNQTTKAVQFAGDIQTVWDVFGKPGIHPIYEMEHDFVVQYLDGRKTIFLTGADGYSKPCREGDWVIPDVKPGTYIAITSEDFRNIFCSIDQFDPGELTLLPVLPEIELKPVTHMLCLNVMVGNADDYMMVYEKFSEMSQEMGKVLPRAGVSVNQVTKMGESITEFDSPPSVYGVTDALLDHGLDSNEVSDIIAHMQRRGIVTSGVFANETHSEETLHKVRKGLLESGVMEEIVDDAISNMQNRGILFRERAQ